MDPMRLDNNKGYIVQTNAYPKNEKVFIPYRKDGVEYHYVDYDDGGCWLLVVGCWVLSY